MLVWICVYTLLFFGVSLLAFGNKTRRTITGIAINLFVFTVSFLPIWVVLFYYDLQEKNSYTNHSIVIDYAAMQRNEFFAEIGGVVLLLFLLATYIHNVYRRWYGLPEE